MISTGEIKRGMTIEIDGNLYQIQEFQHIKMGRGSAQVRMKLRNIRKGDTIEKTVQAGEKFSRARLDHRDVQYLYHEGDHYNFMDTSSYEQLILDRDQLGDAAVGPLGREVVDRAVDLLHRAGHGYAEHALAALQQVD